MKYRSQTKTEKSLFNDHVPPDTQFLTLVSILTISGIVWIYDASAVIRGAYYTQRQIIFVLIGGVFGFVLYKYFSFFKRYFSFALVAILILLVLVITPGIAKDVNGAYRWISIGSFDIQPSEFAKPILIVALANVLAKFHKFLKNRKLADKSLNFKSHLVELWFPYCSILGIFSLLILLERDLGTIIVIVTTAIAVLYTAYRSFWNVIFIFLLVILGTVMTFISIQSQDYRQNRFEIYKELLFHGNLEQVSKDVRLGIGYQLEQILIAIGSGGWTGTGFTLSKQKYFYLVDQTSYTDTIFAVIGEEMGFVGASTYIILYYLLFFQSMKIAYKIKDDQMKFIAYGIIYWITIQSFFNIAANLSIVPLKGLTLPFISYGGSSIIGLLAATGIYLHTTKYRDN